MNRETAVDYLNQVERVYIVDAFAGWDKTYRYKIRIVCSRAYHALFMWNMLIRPTDEELANFGEPDFVIYNAGRWPGWDGVGRTGQLAALLSAASRSSSTRVCRRRRGREGGGGPPLILLLSYSPPPYPPPSPAQAAPLPTGMPPTPPTPPRRSTYLWSTTRWSSSAPSTLER